METEILGPFAPSRRHRKDFKKPSRAKQSMRAECDINVIMDQVMRTGVTSHFNSRPGRYVDLPDSVDYQEAIASIDAGREAFAELPAKVRKRFANDPARFLAFMDDPSNAEEIYSLGLAERPQEPARAPEVIPEPKAEPASPDAP